MITLKELTEDTELNELLLDFATAMATEFDARSEVSHKHVLHESLESASDIAHMKVLLYIRNLVNSQQEV